jgi:hypothetical protein
MIARKRILTIAVFLVLVAAKFECLPKQPLEEKNPLLVFYSDMAGNPMIVATRN